MLKLLQKNTLIIKNFLISESIPENDRIILIDTEENKEIQYKILSYKNTTFDESGKIVNFYNYYADIIPDRIYRFVHFINRKNINEKVSDFLFKVKIDTQILKLTHTF